MPAVYHSGNKREKGEGGHYLVEEGDHDSLRSEACAAENSTCLSREREGGSVQRGKKIVL